jgi:hypothetical protein
VACNVDLILSFDPAFLSPVPQFPRCLNLFLLCHHPWDSLLWHCLDPFDLLWVTPEGLGIVGFGFGVLVGAKFGDSSNPNSRISSESSHAPFDVSITPGMFVVLLVSLNLGSIFATGVDSLEMSWVIASISAFN